MIVGLNSDASIRRIKGFHRPILNENDRAAVVGALDCVDIVIVFEHMSRDNTYDVAGDAELMKAIEDAIRRVKAPFWRQRCEQALSEIRTAKTRNR